jgi:hypothetical protein
MRVKKEGRISKKALGIFIKPINSFLSEGVLKNLIKFLSTSSQKFKDF